MSQRVEILAGWDGSSLIPLRKYQAICDRELVIGERYIAALEPLSSPASPWPYRLRASTTATQLHQRPLQQHRQHRRRHAAV